ncbi:MAG: hypothetical protein Q9159_000030 [Coniocarpon cinnabarinum]
MGNSSSREARNSNDNRSNSQTQSPTSPSFSFSLNPPSNDRSGGVYSSRGGRSSRNDLALFSIGGSGEVDPNGQRKETKQEREARKLEKERLLRARDRDRSMREEGVDGGYLVTLGTYVGPEDFSKITVRQLQIERRLAPFWRGLNDHSDSWTEHQLVAAARGLPIPPPDQIPPQEESPSPTEDRHPQAAPTPAGPQPARLERETSQASVSLPAQNDLRLGSSPSAPTPSPLFRGRTKPVASLSPGIKDTNQPDIPRNEIRLPPNPQINGQPLEAYLYKDVRECPICFLYYPPYLNRTRCCDQSICSECFVQIKRPDPHPPEHTDPSSPPENRNPQALDGTDLVCEPATCPFCKMPELGITYDPPPFRRGLAYNDTVSAPDGRSLNNNSDKRPRGQSMSVNHPDVITTDTVRPDWAKKLADARSHQARRSAAATALHTAAYMMNDRGSGFPGLGRRRRAPIIDYNGEGSSNRPENMNPAHLEQIMAVLENQDQSTRPRRGNGNGSDLFPNRGSSRGNRPEDLEELMMMEAIRLSLQAEEERKKKEEKEAEKERKKEDKKRAKEQKKADKAARKNGTSSFNSSRNNSQYFTPSHGQERTHSQSPGEGKGKAKLSEHSPAESKRSRAYQPGGFNPLDEPTSTLNLATANQQRPEDPQRPPEQDGVNLARDMLTVQTTQPRSRSITSTESSHGDAGNQVENPSSSAPAGPLLPPIPTTEDNSASSEGMFNFTSLNEMIDKEHVQDRGDQSQAVSGNRSRGASSTSQTNSRQYPVGNGQATRGGDGAESKHGSSVAVTGHSQEI